MNEREEFSALRRATAGARDWTDAAIKLDGPLPGQDDPAQAELIGLKYILSVDRD
jgi:hypothetical protein